MDELPLTMAPIICTPDTYYNFSTIEIGEGQIGIRADFQGKGEFVRMLKTDFSIDLATGVNGVFVAQICWSSK